MSVTVTARAAAFLLFFMFAYHGSRNDSGRYGNDGVTDEHDDGREETAGRGNGMLLGMLLNCESGTFPSIIYMTVPMEVTRMSTKKKKMEILGALIHRERRRRLPSLMNVKSLKIRNTRMSRNARITSK